MHDTMVLNVDGQQVELKYSDMLPLLYKVNLKRNFVRDLTTIARAFQYVCATGREFTPKELNAYNHICYALARHANPQAVPKDINTWMDGFATFPIYETMPKVVQFIFLKGRSYGS